MGQNKSKLNPTETSSTSTSKDAKDAHDASKLALWEKNARKNQQMFLQHQQAIHFRKRLPSICKFLKQQCKQCSEAGDGTYINNAEMNALKKLIGTLMFEKPKDQALQENNFTGFNKDEMKTINIVFEKLTDTKDPSGNGVKIAMVWISLMNGGVNEESTEVPVFRVPDPNKETGNNFVDLLGRRYKDWGDFISNNKLPSSKCCYPKEGVYSADENGNVELDLGCTPEATLARKIFRGTDVAGGVIGVGAGIGTTIFPPAFIACCVISGVVCAYGIVRTSVNLADRGNHKQSIRDREAAREWVSLVGSILGLGSSGAMVGLRVLAAEGKLVSGTLNLAVDGLKCVTGVVNSLGFMDQTLHMMRHNGKLGPLQSFQMAANIMLVIACAGLEAIVSTVIRIAQEQVVPLIVREMKSIFQKIQRYISLNDLLKTLENISKKFPYGPDVMRAIRLIIDCYNCKSINDASKIVNVFMELLNRLYIVRTQDSSSNVKEEKEIMSAIVSDDNFVPQLLQFLESEEKIYHFPSDHCHWGDNGELLPEEYEMIGLNFLEIPKGTQSHMWIDSTGTANVHFEQFGLVSIKSCVSQQTITLNNIKKATQSILE